MDAVKVRQKTADKQTQSKYDEAVKKFNVKPSSAIEYMLQEGLIDKANQAQDIAFFFVCFLFFRFQTSPHIFEESLCIRM
jgi:Sec7-like guanine-nucleotide exchange factor